MHTFTRIITRLTPVWAMEHPQELLFCGKNVFTPEDKVRTFHLQKVKHDDDLTRLYITGHELSERYVSLEKFYKDYPPYRDTIILDFDNSYQIYKPI